MDSRAVATVRKARLAVMAIMAVGFVAAVAVISSKSVRSSLIQIGSHEDFMADLLRMEARERRQAQVIHTNPWLRSAGRGFPMSIMPENPATSSLPIAVVPPHGGEAPAFPDLTDDEDEEAAPVEVETPEQEAAAPVESEEAAPAENAEEPPAAANEEEVPPASPEGSAFPIAAEPEAPAEEAPAEEPAAEEEAPAAAAAPVEEEAPAPALLGDEVIDLPQFSQDNDYGDMYLSGEEVANNRYQFKQRRGVAGGQTLYAAADPFDQSTHKPPCKFQCIQDPWGPGCDGHAALSNGDCEEVMAAGWDRVIPADKIAPATYDAYSGNTHGFFTAKQAQALLARHNAVLAQQDRAAGQAPVPPRPALRRPSPASAGRAPRGRRASGLWLGDNWYIEGLTPSSQNTTGAQGKSLFDFGPADGLPISPESGMPLPGATEYWIPGDGETRPGLFDIAGVRANEDGGLPAWWYAANEPAANFWRGRGRGGWAPGRSPTVMVVDGHVEYIDDGVGF